MSAPRIPAKKCTEAEKLWARVAPPNLGPFKPGCREWLGARNTQGYGHISRGGKTRTVTHVALELHDGLPVLPGTFVLHSCDNPACVEPTHLRRGTAAENNADTRARGHAPRGGAHWSRVCPDRLPRGEQHGHAKLTAAAVLGIRNRAAMCGSQRQIARDYHVSQACVWRIIHRKTWTHI